MVDPTQLFHANIFYPHRNTLAFSELNLFAGLLAVPPYWISGSPYVAYNTVALLTFMMSVVGAYALVRYLTGRRPAAAVAGVLFAFCPFVFARTAHMQLLMTAGLPFGMLAVHRLVDRPGVGRGITLGLVLAITSLASGYYALFTGLIVGVAILFSAAGFGPTGTCVPPVSDQNRHSRPFARPSAHPGRRDAGALPNSAPSPTGLCRHGAQHAPVAAAVCGELLSLPLYPSMTEAAVTRVVGAVASSNIGVVP